MSTATSDKLPTASAKPDSAQLSGLDDEEEARKRIGKDWHPFGSEDEHQLISKEGEVDESENESSKSSSSGGGGGGGGGGGHNPLHSLMNSFKKLGSKTTKPKSHRFSDLLRLHKEVKRDLSDPKLYPELEKDAFLRRNNRLSAEEAAFLQSRKDRIVASQALKRFLNLDEDVHPDDVPIIGLGGSGGGYRACLGFLAYIEEMQHVADESQTGAGSSLWDLVMFVAGVSGSCWSIGGLYTIAQMQAGKLLDHFASSSQHHPLSMTAIDAVARSANGVYFQLAPILQKIKIGHLHPGPLDLYGTLVTSHIFFSPLLLTKDSKKELQDVSNKIQKEEGTDPNDDLVEKDGSEPALRREWFQFSKTFERNELDKGMQPLPIITAVRHERPWKDWKSPTEPFHSTHNQETVEHKDEHAWWTWAEYSPIEFGSDELEGWIPTWAFGRHFDGGKSTQRLPERSLSLLLGICTSAPAGPLAAWLATIYRNLPTGYLGSHIKASADHWVEEHPKEAERIQSHHPVHAMNEANPFYNAERKENRGQGFENSPRIHMVDAGMSNNLPQYSFFRPGRDVDLMLLCDFSSDVQSGAALQRIEQFGLEKGIEIKERTSLPDLPPWPQEELPSGTKEKTKNKQLSADEIKERFKNRYAQVLDCQPIQESDRSEAQGPTHVDDGIRYNKRHQPQATARTNMIYMPLLPNACQPEYDPSTAPFSSSYNLVWTEKQVDTIRKTSRANVVEGLETIRSTVREIYERKKAKRCAAEG